MMSPITYSGASCRRTASRHCAGMRAGRARDLLHEQRVLRHRVDVGPRVCPFQRATRARPWAMSSISISRMASRASRAGTGRRRGAATSTRWLSIPCWWSRSRGSRGQASAATGSSPFLLHDAAGIRHRRHHLALQDSAWRRLQGRRKRLLAAIHIRFGLPVTLPKPLTTLAKTADHASAFLEATRPRRVRAG